MIFMLITNVKTEAQNSKGCTSDKSWDFSTGFLDPSSLPPLHTSDTRGSQWCHSPNLSPREVSLLSHVRSLMLHPLLGKVAPFLTAELSSCSRARGEFSLLLKSFLCVIHWFLNSSMAELLKVLIWGLWICQQTASLSPSVFRALWETDMLVRHIEIKVSTLIGVRHRGRAPQVRAYNRTSQHLPPRFSEEAGVGACVCRLRVGDIFLMDRLVLGEDTEVCSFLLHWPSQLSPSCLGENWKGTIRKVNALQNFEEVKFLFCGAGRGRKWPPLAIMLFEEYLAFRSRKEKAMATRSSTLAWQIPWTKKPGRLQSMGSLGVGHDWETSLSLFTFMHWRRKWQPTPVFLPGESQGQGNLVGCRLWGRTELDTTEAT